MKVRCAPGKECFTLWALDRHRELVRIQVARLAGEVQVEPTVHRGGAPERRAEVQLVGQRVVPGRQVAEGEIVLQSVWLIGSQTGIPQRIAVQLGSAGQDPGCGRLASAR